MHKALSKENRNMTTYGYARVSTNGQDLTSQEHELTAAGCAKVFKEKVSGAMTDRAELAKLIRRLEPGDVLIVTRLDRLAPLDSGSTERLGHDWRAGSWLSQPERRLGRYHHPTRQADANGAWRASRV